MDDRTTRFSDPSTVEARRISFGAGAATYDAVRPPWPAATVGWMLGESDDPLDVLDLGAGTGLGTRTIAGLGHRVTAVDPSAEMLVALGAARQHLPSDVAARIRTRVGAAEDLADDDAAYDAVTCFQAWHWVDATRAEPECARVLRPGGWLSLAGHAWSDQVDWLRNLSEIVGTPEMIWDAGGGATKHRKPIDGFAPAEYQRFKVEQRLTADQLVALASTWSPVAVRDDRDAVLTDVRALGSRVAGSDGTLVFSYLSDCYRYRRLG